MNTTRLITFLLVAAGIAAACNSGVSDSSLIGTWTNDDDLAITLTIVPNPGTNPAFTGTLVGTLATPDVFGMTLAVDVQRDALDKPELLVPSLAAMGFRDILCEGCNVTGPTMQCTNALAYEALDGGVQRAYGRSCNWTRTSAPDGGVVGLPPVPTDGGTDGPALATCQSVTATSLCAAASCPSETVPCGDGLCPTDAVCVDGACACAVGFQPACCSGEVCPEGGCSFCADNYGCFPVEPVGCADGVAGARGICSCADGTPIPFSCGTPGTCEQLCAGHQASGDGG
jgi:hypothetical protein